MDLVTAHKKAWMRQSRPDWTVFSRTRWLAVVLALALLPIMFIPSSARAGQYDSVQAGSLFLRKHGSENSVPAARVDTHIEAHVSGMIARVTVRQTFRNGSAEWMDGRYVFPLAEKVAVDRLQMQIGERIVVGEIREREAARKVFEQARTSGKQASLVEQERPNLFITSVANIPPGETVEVKISYLESLDYSGDEWRMRIPLTITPRYVPGGTHSEMQTVLEEANRIAPPMEGVSPQSQRASIEVSIDAGMRLDKLKSLRHAMKVSDSGRLYQLKLEEGLIPTDCDFELVWSPQVGIAPAPAVFTERFGADTYAMLMLIPPHETSGAVRQSREVIFIIDTSGSMQGESIVQAKVALELALERLGPRDLFNLIQFNSYTETLFPRPLPGIPENRAAAREYVRALEANNGTEMRAAFEAAFGMPASPAHLRQIVFITDGAVSNEDELFGLIKTGLGDARLFTVGIGSAPNGHFMRSAAAAGRGTFTFIGSGQVQERMSELFRKIENPALTDVELRWPQGVQVETALAQVPDVYFGEPVVVTARLQGELAGMLSLTGRSATGVWMRQALLTGSRAHEGVASLWARNRIQDVLDQKRAQGDSEVLRKQVTDLALTHHLVSPYTSLVAVDRTPVRPPGVNSNNTVIPLTAPAGMGTNIVYPATATDSRWHLLVGALLLLIGLALVRRRQVVDV